MRPIQMVDLKTEYQRLKTDIDTAVINVIDSAAFINGKPVQEFSKALSSYLDVKHVIPCANGTDALQIAMMALGLKPGDEVITPSFTYIATTEVVALLNLKPVFVEVDKQTFNIDVESLRKAITPKTKAIVPVHLYGQTCDMEAVMQVAKEYNLAVIEDNAQSIGGDYYFSDGSVKKAGTIGTIGTTSFYPAKNLGAYGDGGAIFTNDDALAQRIMMTANHGQSKRYYHDVVGCNSRLDTIQAAILNIRLQHLDANINARIKVADFYDAAFKGHAIIQSPFRAKNNRHVFHQYTLILNSDKIGLRDGLSAYLSEKKIPNMIYYPVPGHRQKMFESFGTKGVDLPVTDWLTERVISLPIHPEMDNEQLEFITENVLGYFK
ncbi:MAG: DegT/DnrJ/EryC1/StrS family aminotransferase [Bacteroidetes bacterium]|nr:DegT/DnrJ/EryC1/StrS family aminotransferase [Bacteroidota bacterium]